MIPSLSTLRRLAHPLRFAACFAGVGLALAANLASAQTSVPYRWQNVKIGGGGFVTGIVFHPAQRGLAYARTDVGGLYRTTNTTPTTNADGSTNIATTWVPLTDFNGPADYEMYGVLSVAIDKNDTNRVYAMCGEYVQSWAGNGALFSSTDQGNSWTRVNLSFKVGGNEDGRGGGERLVVDPNKGSILYMGTNANGLWKSTDYGATWSQVANFPTTASVTCVAIDPATNYAGAGTESRGVYVGIKATSGATFYRTLDGGASWAYWNPSDLPAGDFPLQSVIDTRGGTKGTLYMTFSNALGPNGITAGAVYKLDLASWTWTRIRPPADTNSTGTFGYCGLAVDPSVANTVWVATIDRWTNGDEVYRTTDGGATWSAGLIGNQSTFNYTQAPYMSTVHPHWISDVTVDPYGSGHAMFTTGYGLFETQKYGANWYVSVNGLEEVVPTALATPSAGSAPLISVIRDFDGFRHTSLTTNPTRLSPSWGNSFSLDFAEPAGVVKLVRTHTASSSTSPYGAISNDGGVTWADFASSPPEASANGEGDIALAADGAKIVWSPQKTTPYRSTDGGATWTRCNWWVTSTANASFTPVADRVDATLFSIYDAAAGKVYCSNDGGAGFWQGATGLPTGGRQMVAAPGQRGHLWLATGSGLWRSTNAGVNFFQVTTVGSLTAIGCGKAATTGGYPTLYIAGTVSNVYGFWRSTDAGASWVRINDAAHQYGFIELISGDARTFGRVYVGTNGRGLLYADPQ